MEILEDENHIEIFETKLYPFQMCDFDLIQREHGEGRFGELNKAIGCGLHEDVGAVGDTIMKTITADPHQFFKDGGWSFLASESDDEDEDDEEEESAFEMSESDLAVSDESSEDESDFDDDASADEGSASDEVSAGEDWDELEKKAKKKDREGGLEDEDSGKKRKR